MSPVQRVIKYFAMAFAAMLMVGILSGVIAVLAGIGEGTQLFTSDREYQSFVEEFDRVTNLDITNYSGKFTIKTGDTDKIVVSATEVPDTISVSVTDNGTLVIKDEGNDGWFFSIITFGFDLNIRTEIEVTLPANFVADHAYLDNGSGSFRIEALKAKVLEYDGGSGAFVGNNITAEEAKLSLGSGASLLTYVEFGEGKLKSGSGAVQIEDSRFTDMKIDSGSGAIRFEGSLLGTTIIESGSGSATYDIEDPIDKYSINAEDGSGGIWINGNRVEKIKDSNSSMPYKLDIDGGSGKVTLNFSR